MARRQAVDREWLIGARRRVLGWIGGFCGYRSESFDPKSYSSRTLYTGYLRSRRRRDLMLCYRHTRFALYGVRSTIKVPNPRLLGAVKLRSGKAMTLRLWTTRRRLLYIAFRDGNLRVHATTRLYRAMEMKVVSRSRLLEFVTA